MMIIKSNGKKEDFSERKLRLSLKRSGVSSSISDDIVSEVKKRLYEGMTTKELYDFVDQRLKRKDACSHCRYNLRLALLRFGPAGYNFEKYVASVLRHYGYKAYNPPQEIKGECVYHEIDVIAKKGKQTIFIEAKFRHAFQDVVNLKDTMATYARYLDLNEGKQMSFTQAWIVTNARFSDRGLAFGMCKGMKLIGWSTPKQKPLSHLIDYQALYPVTVLDLQKKEIYELAANNILLCKDILSLSVSKLKQILKTSTKRATYIYSLCEKLVNEDSDG